MLLQAKIEHNVDLPRSIMAIVNQGQGFTNIQDIVSNFTTFLCSQSGWEHMSKKWIFNIVHHFIPREQSSWGQHGAHLGPTGPRWTPYWPPELCYLGAQETWTAQETWSVSGFPFTSMVPAWICNYIYNKVWDEITCPFSNFNGKAIEVWEWISHFISNFTVHVINWLCWDLS